MIKDIKKDLILNNGQRLPLKGFGTYLLKENVEEVLRNAINIGYRHFDTASMYKNEEEIGKALNKVFSEGKVKREEIFLTTKIWNNEKDDVEKSLRASLGRLQLDYVDLYLIHWPMGYYDEKEQLIQRPLHLVWQDMEDCVKKGLCKSIGVSNFNVQILLDLLTYAKIKPVVNEIEFNPYLQQVKLVKFCQKFGIQVIGYSSFCRNRIDVVNEPVLLEIAKKYNRKTTEIILKWCFDYDVAIIPKTTNLERLKENFFFDDIQLDEEDLKKIGTLHCGKRLTDRMCNEDFKIPLFD